MKADKSIIQRVAPVLAASAKLWLMREKWDDFECGRGHGLISINQAQKKAASFLWRFTDSFLIHHRSQEMDLELHLELSFPRQVVFQDPPGFLLKECYLLAHSCTMFPCYLGMEIYAEIQWTITKIVELGHILFKDEATLICLLLLFM